MKTAFVTSADGTRIGYRELGTGPGLVIVHGNLRASQHYLALAEALAERHTVFVLDRRGRGLSGVVRGAQGMQEQCDDLAAVRAGTGADIVFGHSSGGLIALESALLMPTRQLILFEPALSIDGSIPTGWVPAFEAALARGDAAAAMMTLMKGLQMSDDVPVPDWLFRIVQRVIFRFTAAGRETAALLPMVRHDVALVTAGEGRPERYAAIRADTLLLGGDRSPAYLRDALGFLARTLPSAERVELTGLDHNAPDTGAPRIVADASVRWLSAPARSVASGDGGPGAATEREVPTSRTAG
jgi:pimeloyl-ACP methyl ester carboxylesterase